MKGTFTITIDTEQADAISVSCAPEFEAVSKIELIMVLSAMCDSVELSEKERCVAAVAILSGPEYTDTKIAEIGTLIGGGLDG